MKILAIDPGPEKSAWLVYDGKYKAICDFGYFDSDSVALWISDANCEEMYADHLVIEMIASYGMPVGKDVFETCVVIGRLIEAWRQRNSEIQKFCQQDRMFRREVKLHLCNSVRAKDSNIRQALIDRFGGSKEKAIGTKKSPGPLYGIKKDLWSALALAVTYADKQKLKELADGQN